jgi:hypothetical protein
MTIKWMTTSTYSKRVKLMFNEAYNDMKHEKDLTAPLPPHRVDEIEVFAESVHAVVHEHDWRVEHSQMSITNPFRVNVVFKCIQCNEMIVREAERPFI